MFISLRASDCAATIREQCLFEEIWYVLPFLPEVHDRIPEAPELWIIPYSRHAVVVPMVHALTDYTLNSINSKHGIFNVT